MQRALAEALLFAMAGSVVGVAILVGGFAGAAGALLFSAAVLLTRRRQVRLGSFWAGCGWTVTGILASLLPRMPACDGTWSGQCYASDTVPVLIGAAVIASASTAVAIRVLVEDARRF